MKRFIFCNFALVVMLNLRIQHLKNGLLSVFSIVRSIVAVSLFMVIVLVSCSRNISYPMQLTFADSLMYTRPDSALSILRKCSVNVQNATEPVRMYYQLLLTTAEDKCYITHNSDSAMLRVVDYYEKCGLQDKLARSYYITGRVYDDMMNPDIALTYYQKAVEEALKMQKYRLLALAYNQIGTLYIHQKLYEESISAYKKSYKYAVMGKDSFNMPYYLCNLGRIFTIQNDIDSTLYYYEKALALGDKEFRRDCIASELASVYIQVEDYENAYRVLLYNRDAFTAWAEYYECTGKRDSSKLCYTRATASCNIYAREEAYRKLSEYAARDNDIKLELSLLKQADAIKDTIMENTKTAEVKRSEALYKYEKIKAERDSLAFSSRLQACIIAVFFILILSLCGLFIVLYRKNQRKLQFSKDQSQRAEYLREQSLQTETGRIENYPISLSITKNASKADFRLSETEKDMFFNEMDARYSNFTLRLRTLYPRITGIELLVCCLIKLNVRNVDIAHITSHSKNGVSSIRNRLYEKIHGRKGSSKLLNEFIVNF